MRTRFLLFAALILVISLSAYRLVTYSPSAFEAVPKQSPYVVSIELCDEVLGFVLTTEPPVWLSSTFPPTDEARATMTEALNAQRIITVQLGRRGCSSQTQT